MSTRPSTHQNAERHNQLWEVRLSLLISIIGISIAAYAFMATPTDPVTTTNSTSLRSLPQQLRNLGYSLRVQNLLRYLRPEPITPDPALPSVMNYIRVHEAVRPTFDPADDSARSNPALPLDPNARSVYDYLRAHGQLP